MIDNNFDLELAIGAPSSRCARSPHNALMSGSWASLLTDTPSAKSNAEAGKYPVWGITDLRRPVTELDDVPEKLSPFSLDSDSGKGWLFDKNRPELPSLLDVRPHERIGFVAHGECMLGRTIRPYNVVRADKSIGSITIPYVVVLPRCYDSAMLTACFKLWEMRKSLYYVAECRKARLLPSFQEKIKCPVSEALVVVALKSKMRSSIKASELSVELRYLEGVAEILQ